MNQLSHIKLHYHPPAGDSGVGARARAALAHIDALRAPPRPTPDFQPADLARPLRFACRALDLELDATTGAITGLRFRPPAATAAAAGEEGSLLEPAGVAGGAGAGEGVGIGEAKEAQWEGEGCSGWGDTEAGGVAARSPAGPGGARRRRRLSMRSTESGAGGQQHSMHSGGGSSGGGGALVQRPNRRASLASKDFPLAQVVYSTYSGACLFFSLSIDTLV